MAQNATWAWNRVAPPLHFSTVEAASPTQSFADAYAGDDFENEFRAALLGTAELMSTDLPDYDGTDMIIASVQNWPDK